MLDQFIAAAEGVGATIKRFSAAADLLAHVDGSYGGKALRCTTLPDRFASLKMKDAAVDAADLDVCLSFARAGIAATGTVMVELDDAGDRAATALPLVHAVILDASSIVRTLADLRDVLKGALAEPQPRYFSLTTGPSRTADIERVLTIGVHGPKELHILILEEGQA
ncbi:MAG TPA: lactate utilization protein [Verrucomicrobiae bacterium]|nr:lactate utilization protein [Verrucomicrobiae bacterium]